MRRATILGSVLLAALLTGYGAHAQFLPGRAVGAEGGLRYPPIVTGVGSATCQAQVNGVTPYLCADFFNGSYVLNGTSYASWTAMGGSLPGGCTISAGTGASCSSTVALTIAGGNPATGYMLVTDAVNNTAAGTFVNSMFYDGSHRVNSLENGGNLRVGAGDAGPGCTARTGASGVDAIYVNASNTYRCSSFNNTVSAATGATNPAANSTLNIGNWSGNSFPVITPYYVKSVRVYIGTFSDAQVQLATTQ